MVGRYIAIVLIKIIMDKMFIIVIKVIMFIIFIMVIVIITVGMEFLGRSLVSKRLTKQLG